MANKHPESLISSLANRGASQLFIDTGAHIALVDKDDQYHSAAKEFYYSEIKSKGWILVTSNLVIWETLNYLQARGGHHVAVQFREKIYSSKIVRIVSVLPPDEEEAWRIFKRYDDKSFSFTDCTSFALMKRLNLGAAFAFDEHFTQFGLLRVP